MLSIDRMRVFAAVFEEGSFTAAAERLNATQSGVSQQIARLERALGTQLLERGARGAVATPAGRQLYARSIALLREISTVERGIVDLGRGATGSVTLGVMPALTRSEAGPVLRRYLAENPNVTINLVERASSELIDEVVGDRLDAAIVPVFDAPPSLRCRLLGRSREALIARPAGDGLHMRPVDVRAVSPMRLILQSEGSIRRRRVLAYLRSRGVELDALMDMDSMFGTLEFVQNSDFVTIVPAVMVAPEIDSAAMCVRPLDLDGLALEVMAVSAARREPSPIVTEILDRFERSLAAFERRLDLRLGLG
ncbi:MULTISPECIES: LysR family transcriptional regulator [Thalassobaculum]|uniref:DNA-binding transcriptional regulator, LysR family n=1 Tax=Thalassobaculum litoreum DSM 18839 TaxID=1123362 RepID=A0A8G2BIN9_9PROT|nr:MULTISPECIES: LysR family transcriptional regulator [Thalassobaculum]SDF93449.1 DNA-binding transcriptional regulator, LysR family [Thalassobaculum litoreum DSM 18839]